MKTATLRWVAGNRITGACPNAVIAETADYVVLYEPAGAIWQATSGVRGGPRGRNNLVDGEDWSFAPREWLGDGVVRVHRFGEEWSTWRWLDGEGHWSPQFYLNLEDPWRRTVIGFDTGDWILDVVVDAGGGAIYKDEDELEWAGSLGGATFEWIARTRAAGARAVEVAVTREWPLNADWDAWLPDDLGALPVLPNGWAEGVTTGTGR